MSKKPEKQTPQLLRAAAEAQLASAPPTQMSTRTTEELLHELSVHQVELEMQNDELRRAQLIMEESRDRYVALYDFAPVGCLTLTHEALISEINFTGAALLGADRNKLIHHSFASLVTFEDGDRWHQHFVSILQHGEQQSFELALKRGDGSRFPAQLDCQRLSNEGNAVRIVLTDISERKQAEDLLRQNNEAQLKLLLNAVVEGIYGVDMRGNCTFINPSALRLLGYQQEAELLGKHMHVLIHHTRADGSEYPAAECRLYHCLQSHEDIHVDDELFWRRDGSSFPVDYWSRPVKRDGEVIGAVITFFDITERKLVASKLLESEALAKSAVAELFDQKFALDQHAIVATTDVYGTITYVNDKFCTISQYTRDELLGQNHRMINSGTHSKEFFRDMYRRISAGKVWHGDCCNRARDGSLYWVATTVVPYLGSDGKPFQYIAIRTDITAKKKIEAILQRYRRVVETAMDGFFITDTPGNVLFANQAYASMSDYTVAELTGMHVSQLEAKEQPEDVEAHKAKIIAQGSDRFESRHRRKDGQVIDVEASVTYMAEKQQFYAFCRDITERKKAEKILKLNKVIIDTTSEGFWLLDLTGHLLEVNQAYADMIGYTREELIGMHISKISLLSDKPELVTENIQKIVSNGYIRFETRHRHKDGRSVDFEVSVSSIGDGQPLFSFLRDITQRKQAEEALRVAAVTFEMHDAILITDSKANIIRVNQAFIDITGYSLEDVLGKNPRIMSSGRQDKTFYIEMWQKLLHTGSWEGEIWDKRKNGQIYPKWMTITAVKNERQETTNYVAIFSDITTRKQAEDEIRNLAFYDPLTKLPNRRLLLDRFHLALSISERSQLYGAALFLDMDKFKTLNDTLGHDYGDLMLIEVAARIQFCVREVDTVARLGGDEFVVLIEEVSANQEEALQRVAQISEKIRLTLALPYQLKGHTYHSSPSIGVCLYCGNEVSVDDLFKHADMAMYQAKDSGRNAVRFFDPLMQQAVELHAALEGDLRHAVPDQQLRLYYQIQVDNEHRAIGAEALVRWIHPLRGLVPPMQFIHVAEESSLMLDIGFWVLDTACRQLAVWGKNEKTRDLILAVNVSGKQFRLHDFVDQVAAVIRDNQIDASRLKLELTESVVLSDVADVVKKMHALKALGVGLSMDDFGTGYSSLSYLKQLPLDQIKIDQSFVRDITTDFNDAVMVQTIIGLAKNFRLNVIAEGVETQGQLEFLKINGCMAYQGYLFSKPVPIEEFEALLDR